LSPNLSTFKKNQRATALILQGLWPSVKTPKKGFKKGFKKGLKKERLLFCG